MSEDGLPPLRDVIATHGLSARKTLGQNFLLDLNLTRRIARAAGPFKDETIVEIGPGPGGLTRALLMEGAKKVIVIERDERTLPALEEIADHYPDKLDIINGDALETDISALTDGQIKIVANLPYNIATPLLVSWLTPDQWPPKWLSLTLMFQKEVAERIVAKAGSAAFGRLAILSQYRANAQKLFDVSRQAFTPPPKVTSSIVQIVPGPQPDMRFASRDLEAVTKAAFGQRRKMLRSSLKPIASQIPDFFEKASIDETKRAEQLSLSDFCNMAHLHAKQSEQKP